MICHRHRAVSILLGYDPALLDFVFAATRTKLRRSPQTLGRESVLIGLQEHMQVKIALDFWDGGRRTCLTDIPRHLDSNRYDCFVAAMAYYVAAHAGVCRCNSCRNR